MASKELKILVNYNNGSYIKIVSLEEFIEKLGQFHEFKTVSVCGSIEVS